MTDCSAEAIRSAVSTWYFVGGCVAGLVGGLSIAYVATVDAMRQQLERGRREGRELAWAERHGGREQEPYAPLDAEELRDGEDAQ